MSEQIKRSGRFSLNVNLVGVIALIIVGAGCSKAIKTDEPIRIVSNGSLDVKLGDQVKWTFKAFRGSREVMIVEVLPAQLPLGVVRDFDAKEPTVSGKVITRDVRHGVLRVMAFDEAACNQSYEAMKKATEAQIKATKDTNVAIPVSPCVPADVSPLTTSPEFLAYGYFSWHMVDGPDELSSDDYGKFFTNNFATPGKAQVNLNLVSIPELEAPHTVDAWLGSCAAKERRFCGSNSDCLWGRVSCISKEATGASSSVNSHEKGKI